MKKKPSIHKVRNFWNNNPLFVGESKEKIGSARFFKAHNKTIIDEIFFGKKNIFKKVFFPKIKKNKKIKVLDLGCGIGFWLSFMENNFNYKLHGSDISSNSINIAKKRVSKKIKFNLQKNERLIYPNGFFNHVNCQGVLHHTTNPEILLSEIFRVLDDLGTCSLSVYYENFILRNYEYFYYFLNLFSFVFKNKGRGRNFKKLPKNKYEVVKLYDGKNNPIGYALSKKEIIAMVENSGFKVLNFKFYFFPIRFLKIKFPNFINNFLSNFLPFMIIINLKK